MHQHRSNIIGLLAITTIVTTPLASAEAHEWRHDEPWVHPKVVVVLPRGTTPLRLGHGGNDYHRGHYYQHDLRGYVVIPAPVGAVAPSLPEGDRTIVIDGIAYHEYGGVYYRGGPAGYTVVPIAQTPQDPGATEAMAGHIAPTPAQHTTVINVLNKNGSYTPVTLQLARSHFKTSDDTTEAQNNHRDTETSRRALLCGSVDFCGSVVWTRVLK